MQVIHSAMVRSGLMPKHSRPDALGGTLRVFGSALRTKFEPREQYLGPVRLVLTDDPRVKADDNRDIHQRMREGWEHWAPHLHVWHGRVTILPFSSSPTFNGWRGGGATG